MKAVAMKPQHSAGAIIEIAIGKNGDLQQLFHTRFSKNLDFIGVSAGLNRRKTPVSALRPPTALRPKPPAAPCELAVYVNHCQDFCNTVKPKKRGARFAADSPWERVQPRTSIMYVGLQNRIITWSRWLCSHQPEDISLCLSSAYRRHQNHRCGLPAYPLRSLPASLHAYPSCRYTLRQDGWR